jgi:hypothetical protein
VESVMVVELYSPEGERKVKGQWVGIDCCSLGWFVLVGCGLVESVTSVELDSSCRR